MPSRLVLGALAALLAGCGIQARLSLAPTLDTAGRVGFEARVSGGFGPGDRDWAVTADPYLNVGYYDVPGEAATLGGGLGVGFTGVTEDSFALHASVFGGGRGSFGLPSSTGATGNFGVELAAGYALHNHLEPGSNVGFFQTDGSRDAVILGLGLRGEVVAGQAEARGLFALPVYLQLFWGT